MREHPNPLRAGLALMLGTGLLWLADAPVPRAAETENHCFTCHTSARKLIKITREIAESRKGQARAEVKSEGEG